MEKKRTKEILKGGTICTYTVIVSSVVTTPPVATLVLSSIFYYGTFRVICGLAGHMKDGIEKDLSKTVGIKFNEFMGK